MANRRHKPEEIVTKLCQVDVLVQAEAHELLPLSRRLEKQFESM